MTGGGFYVVSFVSCSSCFMLRFSGHYVIKLLGVWRAEAPRPHHPRAGPNHQPHTWNYLVLMPGGPIPLDLLFHEMQFCLWKHTMSSSMTSLGRQTTTLEGFRNSKASFRPGREMDVGGPSLWTHELFSCSVSKLILALDSANLLTSLELQVLGKESIRQIWSWQVCSKETPLSLNCFLLSLPEEVKGIWALENLACSRCLFWIEYPHGNSNC